MKRTTRLGVRLLTFALAAAASLGLALLAPAPARADGLNFACDPNSGGGGGGGGGATPSPGDQLAAILGFLKNPFSNQFVQLDFSGRTDSGPTVTLTDVAGSLGGTNGTWTIGGLTQAGSDLRVLVGGRLGSANSPLAALLKDSFAVPYDMFSSHILLGVDLTVARTQAPGSPYHFNGLDATVTLRVRTGLNDPWVHVDFGFASRVNGQLVGTPAGEFPESATMTAAVRTAPWPNQGYLAAALTETYRQPVESGTDPRPALQHRVHVYEAGKSATPLADVGLGWTHGPRSFALGMNLVCDILNPATSRTQLSWQYDGASAGPDNTVVVGVRAGGGNGIDGLDDAAVAGTVAGIPDRLDAAIRPDSILLSRATLPQGKQTDVTLDHFDLASVNPQLGDDYQEPIIVSAEVTNLPERTFVHADRDGAGTFVRESIEFCPATNPLPAEVIVPTGPCSQGSPTAADMAEVHYRNYLTNKVDPAVGIPAFSHPPNREYVDFASVGTDMCAGISPLVPACKRPRIGLVRLDLLTFGPERAVVGDPDPLPFGWSGFHVTGVQRSAQTVDFGMHLDKRTSLDETANAGTLMDVTATGEAVPKAFDVDIRGNDANPLQLRSTMLDPIDRLEAKVRAQLAGPDARVLRLHGNVEHVPPTLKLSWTEGTPKNIRLETAAVNPQAAAPRATIDADLTTTADRAAGERLAISGELQLPRGVWNQPPFVDVKWITANSVPTFVQVGTCEVPGDCDNHTSATIARRDDYNPQALTPASLPSVPFTSIGPNGRHPDFTHTWTTEGLTLLFLDADHWGVKAGLANLRVATLVNAGGSLKAELRTRTTGAPFAVNAFLQGTDNNSGGPGNRFDVYADAVLSFLPPDAAVRIWERPTNSQPLFLLTTDPNLYTGDPGPFNPDRTWPPTPPSTAVLTGTVRVGDPVSLATARVLDWMRAPSYDSSTRKIDAQFWVPTPPPGKTQFAVDAFVQEDVPKDLVVWMPTDLSCMADQPNYAACQSLPYYEAEEVVHVKPAVQTSSPDLGRLDVEGGIGGVVAGRYQDKTGVFPETMVWGSASVLPGSLQADLTLKTNRRLPWVLAGLVMDANRPIPELRASVYQPASPGQYRVKANPNDPDATVDTSNYGLVLQNLPKHVDLGASIFDEEPVGWDTSTPVKCAQPGESGLGYLHGRIDFKNAASLVRINAKSLPGGADHAVDLWSSAPLDADVSLRLNHIRMAVRDSTSFIVPLVVVDICVDLDLPVTLSVANANRLVLGQHGIGVTFDVPPGAQGSYTVGEGGLPQTPPGAPYTEPQPSSAGVYYWYERKVLWLITLLIPTGGYAANYQGTNVFQDVNTYSWEECNKFLPCWAGAGPANGVALGPGFSDPQRNPVGLNAYSLVLDPLLSAAERSLLFVGASGIPPSPPTGWKIVNALVWRAGKFNPLSDADRAMPDLGAAAATPATVVVNSPGGGFACLPVPAGVATDATTYWIDNCAPPEFAARFPGGALRWRVPLPTPGFGGNGACWADACDVTYTVSPQVDGSIRVDAATVDRDNNNNLGSYTVHYDASGHPARTGWWPPVSPNIPWVSTTGGQVTIDPCPLAPICIAQKFPWAQGIVKEQFVWYPGDGTIESSTQPILVHDYALPGKQYFAVLVDHVTIMGWWHLEVPLYFRVQ